jgi:glycosyltransferase involved in cell wall biosynthesis
LAEPKDVDSLAAKLRLLAGDAPLRRSLEKRAAASAERFRWERIAAEYLRLY